MLVSGSTAQEDTVGVLAELVIMNSSDADVFYGDPKEWLSFIGTFESNVASKHMSNAKKFQKLWKLLGTKPRSYVKGNLINPELGYVRALETLVSLRASSTCSRKHRRRFSRK